MWNWRYIGDVAYSQTTGIQRSNCRLAPGSGSINFYIQVSQTIVLDRGLTGLFGGYLGGEGSAFPGASETGTSGSRPTERVALAIGNSDDRIIKRGMNMRNAIDDGGTRFLFCRFLCWLCHKLFHLALQRACSVLGLTKRHEVCLPTDWLSWALSGSRIGLGTLASDRQRATVTNPAVTTEIHQSLDVHRDFSA